MESNGTVTIVGAGVATMRATQDGNGSYNAAPSVEKTLTVTKAPQTITFNALSDASLITVPTRSLAKRRHPPDWQLATPPPMHRVASLSGTTLTLHQGGSVTITASQRGNDTYCRGRCHSVPDRKGRPLLRPKHHLDQTISGLSIGGADVNMTAKSIDADTGADTNLTITYTSSDTAVVSIVNGTYLRIVGAGSATITASQAGNVRHRGQVQCRHLGDQDR